MVTRIRKMILANVVLCSNWLIVCMKTTLGILLRFEIELYRYL